jgi:hypothetical protein
MLLGICQGEVVHPPPDEWIEFIADFLDGSSSCAAGDAPYLAFHSV